LIDLKHISHPANSSDELRLASKLNFGSQQTNESIQRIALNLSTYSPDSLDNPITFDDMTGMPHQQFKQSIFSTRKIDKVFPALYLVIGLI
jgi:hypothetical protein